MSFEEALQVLGLKPSDGAGSERRAYLRLLKTHKPERDPEGFRRLRDALEVVQHSPWAWHSLPTPAETDDSPPSGSPPGSDSPSAHPAAFTVSVATRDEYDTSSPLATEGGEGDEDDDYDIYDRLDECESSEQRVALCGARIAKDPSNPVGYSCLAHELVTLGEREEAATVLRRGAEQGAEGLLEQLIRILPELATEQEVDRTLSPDSAIDLQQRAGVERAHGAHDTALKHLGEALNVLAAQGGGIYEHRSQLEGELLQYLEDGSAESHHLLLRHLALVRTDGLERKMVQYDDLLVVLVGELLENWDALTDPARRDLIAIMLEPNEERELQAGSKQWRATLKTLRKHGHALHALASERIRDEKEIKPKPTRSWFTRWFRWIALWAAVRVSIDLFRYVFF